MQSTKQNIYIRKLNGLGQKICVQSNLTIKQLKNIILSSKNMQESQLKQTDFNLIFKGKNITQKLQWTLKQLNIPSDGIIHLLFKSENNLNSLTNLKSQAKDNHQLSSILQNNSSNFSYSSNNSSNNNSLKDIKITINQSLTINLRIIFNSEQYDFPVSSFTTILQFKKNISAKLNLVYESLILSHLGIQMEDQKFIKQYSLANNTLISLKFNLQRNQKKKLESRLVNSVTFSDQNHQPNRFITGLISTELNNLNNKFMVSSSKSIDSDKEQVLSKKNNQNYANKNMYKSQINAFSTSSNSKAALMFKNALNQKIAETQSIVSGSFSEDTLGNGSDPNMLLITVRNEQETKQFIFQCSKVHQIKDIRYKMLEILRIQKMQDLQISIQQDLFQSIDLNSSACITLNQIVKKMGKQRAIFIYRIKEKI